MLARAGLPRRAVSLWNLAPECGLPQLSVLVTDEEQAVEEFLEAWQGSRHFGLDREHKPVFRKGQRNPTALLQVCAGQRVLLFDLLRSPLPPALRRLLEDPERTFYGMGLEEDLASLASEHACMINGVDLNKNAWDVGKIGLVALGNQVLGSSVLKDRRTCMSNWEQRPLKQAQVTYAARDAYLSWAVAEHFLREQGPARPESRLTKAIVIARARSLGLKSPKRSSRPAAKTEGKELQVPKTPSRAAAKTEGKELQVPKTTSRAAAKTGGNELQEQQKRRRMELLEELKRQRKAQKEAAQ